MANGYATLVTVLSDDRNLPLIQEAVDKYFWRGHIFIDAFLGALTDYFSVHRLGAYKNLWQRWIIEDWVGSYIARVRSPLRLEKLLGVRYVSREHAKRAAPAT